MPTGEVVVKVRNLKKYFELKKGFFSFGGEIPIVKAVDDVNFDIRSGEILGLVGESGCGKTTTGRLLTRLEDPTDGFVFFLGRDIALLEGSDIKVFRRNIQMVFQDPYESLNPRTTVLQTIMEPLINHNIGKYPRAAGRDGRPGARGRRAGTRQGVPEQVPARAQRRAEAEGVHREGAGHQAQGHNRRRARLDAGRVHPGGRAQLDARPEGQVRNPVPVHHPRHRGREVCERPAGGHVPGEGRGAGGHREDHLRIEAPVHAGVAVGRPRA